MFFSFVLIPHTRRLQSFFLAQFVSSFSFVTWTTPWCVIFQNFTILLSRFIRHLFLFPGSLIGTLIACNFRKYPGKETVVSQETQCKLACCASKLQALTAKEREINQLSILPAGKRTISLKRTTHLEWLHPPSSYTCFPDLDNDFCRYLINY